MTSGSAYFSGPPDALGEEICTPLTATPTPPTTVACFGVALKTAVRGIVYVFWAASVCGTSAFAYDVRLGSAQSMRYCGTLLLVTVIVVDEQVTDSSGSV